MLDQPIGAEAENKLIAILKILSESPEPLGSITLARELEGEGIFLSERAVRYHLKIADARGYTRPAGRDGRTITDAGRREVKEALAPQHLGFVRDKLELLAYQTTFDPATRTGQVAINTSIMARDSFKKAIAAMKDAYRAGLCVSQYVATAAAGEKLGSLIVPEGKIGLATICGATINGVLLKAGVPTEFKFGGVLEIRDFKPRRFTAVIDYAGTSIDPSEQFIQSKMTGVSRAAATGSGKILASFRTIPGPAREAVVEKLAALKDAGIDGVYALGNISEPLCQVSVAVNRFGVVQLGGLNPVAAAVEAGVEIENIAESGLMDFKEMRSFREL